MCFVWRKSHNIAQQIAYHNGAILEVLMTFYVFGPFSPHSWKIRNKFRYQLPIEQCKRVSSVIRDQQRFPLLGLCFNGIFAGIFLPIQINYFPFWTVGGMCGNHIYSNQLFYLRTSYNYDKGTKIRLDCDSNIIRCKDGYDTLSVIYMK